MMNTTTTETNFDNDRAIARNDRAAMARLATTARRLGMPTTAAALAKMTGG